MKRVAEDEAIEIQQPSAQWSEVDIAGGEVVAAGQEIEFIAKVTVAGAESSLNEKSERAENPRRFHHHLISILVFGGRSYQHFRVSSGRL